MILVKECNMSSYILYEYAINEDVMHGDDDDEYDIPVVPNDDENTKEDLTFDDKELTPIKRYYLINKLVNLKNKLNQMNQYDDNLDLVLQFSDSISYPTLVKLTKVLIKDITKNVNLRSKLLAASIKQQNDNK